MKYQENMTQVAALQPNYLGFIFYPESPRYFNTLNMEVPDGIKKVGVFVNETTAMVLRLVNHFKLDGVQLHGNESPEYCKTLLRTFSDCAHKLDIDIIKAFSIKDEFDFNVLRDYEDSCSHFLFDTKGALPGGNGYTFDWSVLNNYPSEKPFFLSGGIGVDQLDDIETFSKTAAAQYCHALDVNSKFELAPGQKEISSLEQFKQHLTKKEILV